MSSDAHTLAALGKNAAGARKLTRLKMETMSFDSLRIALNDPVARARIEDLVPPSGAKGGHGYQPCLVPYWYGMPVFVDSCSSLAER
jgi:hypothetical protein